MVAERSVYLKILYLYKMQNQNRKCWY